MPGSAVTERAVVEKCAALLKVPVAALGSDLSLVVVATNDSLLPGQVINLSGRRLVMVAELSREEFEIARVYNAKVRARRRRPRLTWHAEGDRPDLLKIIEEASGEPARECGFYALVKDLE